MKSSWRGNLFPIPSNDSSIPTAKSCFQQIRDSIRIRSSCDITASIYSRAEESRRRGSLFGLKDPFAAGCDAPPQLRLPELRVTDPDRAGAADRSAAVGYPVGVVNPRQHLFGGRCPPYDSSTSVAKPAYRTGGHSAPPPRSPRRCQPAC